LFFITVLTYAKNVAKKQRVIPSHSEPRRGFHPLPSLRVRLSEASWNRRFPDLLTLPRSGEGDEKGGDPSRPKVVCKKLDVFLFFFK